MTGYQARVFLEGEGAAWLERNKSKLPPAEDPVIQAIDKIKFKPTFVLEVGCANGWRLLELRKQFGCICHGIDPAVKETEQIGDFVNIRRGTADSLPYEAMWFDTVIYGFCLYLCDPKDHFRIVSEGDRVLTEGGELIIYDFHSDVPYSRRYSHHDGVFSHKMDFAKLWLCHPSYSLVTRNIIGSGDDALAVTVLRKQRKNAFPVRE